MNDSQTPIVLDDRLIIISTDGHCGADIPDYKPYLESRFHGDFDDWADNYSDAWLAMDPVGEGERSMGVASTLDPVNWEGSKRTEMLEEQGISAEVLFPNTVPPFYPSGAISAPGPRSEEEYVRRLAGIKAHNRWLADFCGELPGRRAGIAQVFLNNVEDAVEEVRWGKEHGLMGVLLPADHFHGLVNLYYPKFDPLWAVCAELDMPVHRHGIIPSESSNSETGPGASAVGLLEALFFAQRAVAHMILGGVFERFPTLKFVESELNSAWAVGYLQTLDGFGSEARVPGTMQYKFARDAFSRLSLTPSEYGRRNCYFGSFMTAADVASRYDLGLDRVMRAADFPHHEGTWPYSREALRVNFADLAAEEIVQLTSLTASECYGFDLAALDPVAKRIGPTLRQVQTPLMPEDYPKYPGETVCNTFASSWGGNAL
jgi:predicted TIM-barrel fold metal-dependent hydrolase